MNKGLVAYIVLQIVLGLIGVLLIVLGALSTLKPSCSCGAGTTAGTTTETVTSCDKFSTDALKSACNGSCPSSVVHASGCGDPSTNGCMVCVARKGPLGAYIGSGIALLFVPAIVYWSVCAAKRH